MPADTYRSPGNHIPVASASGTIAAGTLVKQEGFWGIAITGAATGESLQLDCSGIHKIAVPASTVKGDVLYADLSGGADILAASITVVRSGQSAGFTIIGKAVGDRDSAGKALVLLAPQVANGYAVS